MNFKNLKQLNLGINKISDISVFEKIIFDKLKILCLQENEIDIYDNALLLMHLNEKIEELKF